ncbi:hypothetical protein GQ53DRAFT_399215 [Thozetella sp. PMI_491]|nr:hypothetical protein GQ53DRAFT_399215 [Thozetella sp. PMI_491]
MEGWLPAKETLIRTIEPARPRSVCSKPLPVAPRRSGRCRFTPPGPELCARMGVAAIHRDAGKGSPQATGRGGRPAPLGCPARRSLPPDSINCELIHGPDHMICDDHNRRILPYYQALGGCRLCCASTR